MERLRHPNVAQYPLYETFQLFRGAVVLPLLVSSAFVKWLLICNFAKFGGIGIGNNNMWKQQPVIAAGNVAKLLSMFAAHKKAKQPRHDVTVPEITCLRLRDFLR